MEQCCVRRGTFYAILILLAVIFLLLCSMRIDRELENSTISPGVPKPKKKPLVHNVASTEKEKQYQELRHDMDDLMS
ncbi:hypothetical protein QR680_015922 [Steinernema hermaphroditum]|uniref:Uncharacterized protein n=1 Tax=Steinernema hermaphroditum TaxID=289476 RepID=A0AA39H9F1_9BILA|nr:hypothetical protein QR680_015922 [Steinernema hermaphroditum]